MATGPAVDGTCAALTGAVYDVGRAPGALGRKRCCQHAPSPRRGPRPKVVCLLRAPALMERRWGSTWFSRVRALCLLVGLALLLPAACDEGDGGGPGCGDGEPALKEAASISDCPTTYCYNAGHCCPQATPIYCFSGCFAANGATCKGCGNASAQCH